MSENNKKKSDTLIAKFREDYPEFASMNFGKTKPTNKTSQDIDTVSTNTTGENRAYKVVGSKKNEPPKTKTVPLPRPRPTRKGPGKKVTGRKQGSLAGSELGTLAGSIKKDLDGEIASKNVDGRKLAKVMRDNSKTGKEDLSLSALNKEKSFRKVSGPDGLGQGKRVYKTPFGKITVDSTDEGMWGKGKTSEDAADFKKGGTAKKKKAVSKYGAKAMKFTNRGGMYKVKR